MRAAASILNPERRASSRPRWTRGSASLQWIIIWGVISFCLTSCQTISRHLFSEPGLDWQAKTGQLQYRGPKTSLIGEVLVRFSKQGDFELTFTKGPGVTLIMIRQNASFVRVTGPLARGSWSGSTASAPAHLRGWLELRDLLLHARDQKSLRHVAGAETFLFEF
jgi:hypothetical protein